MNREPPERDGGRRGAEAAPAKGWRTGAGRGWRWMTVLGLGLVGLVLARQLPVADGLKRALAAVGEMGVWGPVIFIGLYVVATVCWVPGSALTLGAGAVFGVVWGSVYVSVGSTLGATCAFLVGRYLVRGTIERKLGSHAKFRAIDQAVAREGWKIVGLTRLSPVFPFTLLNYAFGLTRVKLGHYVVASWVGMMPGTVMYVYLGSVARAAVGGERSRTPAEWGLYGVGLVATVVVGVWVARIARKAIAARVGE